MSNHTSTQSQTSTTVAVEDRTIPLDEILSVETDENEKSTAQPSESILTGVVIGTFVDWNDEGQPLVDFPGNQCGAPLAARTTAVVEAFRPGREIALMFESGNPSRPIILGAIQCPPVNRDNTTTNSHDSVSTLLPVVHAEVDNERVMLTADKEIVLKCGKSSITLTKAGKVLIRGAFLLSRSSGVNRIKGGSVQIN